MLSPRRLSFQLTPLLDLLLIVIFAQFMDVRETTQQEESASKRQINELAAQLQASQSSLNDLRTQSTEEFEKLDQLQKTATEQQDQIAELQKRLEQATRQRDMVGELASKLFQLPKQLVEETLRPPSPAERSVRTQEETEQLLQQFRELAALRKREVVQHLLTYDQLRKRCDIWEIYISSKGRVELTTDEGPQPIRAQSAEQFQNELFGAYKLLSQPKGLVIILLTYGDAKAGVRNDVISSLPKAAERMRADSNGRTRFEYANLGFHPREDDVPAK